MITTSTIDTRTIGPPPPSRVVRGGPQLPSEEHDELGVLRADTRQRTERRDVRADTGAPTGIGREHHAPAGVECEHRPRVREDVRDHVFVRTGAHRVERIHTDVELEQVAFSRVEPETRAGGREYSRAQALPKSVCCALVRGSNRARTRQGEGGIPKVCMCTYMCASGTSYFVFRTVQNAAQPRARASRARVRTIYLAAPLYHTASPIREAKCRTVNAGLGASQVRACAKLSRESHEAKCFDSGPNVSCPLPAQALLI
jgi:hypothetical protein